jgi:hypothetical protein
MVMRTIVVAAAVFVIFAAAAFAGFQIATAGQNDAATVDRKAVNESLTQQVGIYQLVDAAEDEYTAGFNDTVTVYNSSDVELTEGTDYEWNSTDGTILFTNTASTSDGAAANITYQYQENTEAVKTLDGPVGAVVSAVGELPLLAAGLGLSSILIGLAVFVGRRLTGTNAMESNR